MDGGDEFEDDPFSTDEDKEYVPSDQSSLDFDDEPKKYLDMYEYLMIEK